MTPSKILVDSSFLYALYDRDAKDSEIVSAVADLFGGQFVIPYVILTETAFLFRRAGEAPAPTENRCVGAPAFALLELTTNPND